MNETTESANTILVVDDDNAVRQSMTRILRNQGYTVMEAANGERALEIATSEPVDLMLLDIRMPGLDGLGVLEKINQIDPDLTVIIMTGHADKDTVYQSLRRNSAYDLLEKPIKPQAILAAVRAGLSEHRARLLQRAQDDDDGTTGERLVVAGGVLFDLKRAEASIGGHILSLTRNEFRLLVALVKRREQVLSGREIVHAVQGYELGEPEAREIVRPAISRLRKKLADYPATANCLVSVRGEGYMFTENVHNQSFDE